MAREQLSEESLVAEYRGFLEPFETVVLATVSGAGIPEASTAPFVWGRWPWSYVYVSDLAQHAANLRETGRVSLLFAEDQSRAVSAFARRRVTFQCVSQLVDRGTREWAQTLDNFAKRFGKVVRLIRPLEDFNLYQLQPMAGSYVRGFADAYRLHGEALEQSQYRDGNDDGESE